MFSLILRNAGFRRTLQPIILQTKEFNNRKYLKISIEIPILQISNEIN